MLFRSLFFVFGTFALSVSAQAQTEPLPCQKELNFVGRVRELPKVGSALGTPICQFKIDIIEQPIPDSDCPLTAREANLLTFADAKCVRKDGNIVRGIISVSQLGNWIQTLD